MFEIYNTHHRLMGKTETFDEARANLKRWKDASYVADVSTRKVVLRKRDLPQKNSPHKP